jgi:hypothetical protein
VTTNSLKFEHEIAQAGGFVIMAEDIQSMESQINSDEKLEH